MIFRPKLLNSSGDLLDAIAIGTPTENVLNFIFIIIF